MNLSNEYVRQNILKGSFGLEKESLRVYGDAGFAHSEHPFPEDKNIVKDFCENQTEINTGINDSAALAVSELEYHNNRIYRALSTRTPKEYLWPFSNPPYIKNEADIPVAKFDGEFSSKYEYREYLSAKYGRYKMTFSGIHVNYSFSKELLAADYKEVTSGKYSKGELSWCDFREYRDKLYLELAKKLAKYGWVLVALTAASPLMDGSFVEKGAYDKDVFTGMGSVRCSELGYWNEFAPVFDYSDVERYAESIRKYVDRGFLVSPSELYYPVRLKPSGENNLSSLKKNGIDHIELRMYDLNPLADSGIETKDLVFAQLMMVYLASIPDISFSDREQVQAVQNFKNAARYDLKTVKILSGDEGDMAVADAGAKFILEMRAFYEKYGVVDAGDGFKVLDVLDFEYMKFIEPKRRYAWIIKDKFGDGFVKKAMELAKEKQMNIQ